MSLLFNILSRLVIAFLPRSKHLLISWLQSPSAVILGASSKWIFLGVLLTPKIPLLPPTSSLWGEGSSRISSHSLFSGHGIKACLACTKLSLIIGSAKLSGKEPPDRAGGSRSNLVTAPTQRWAPVFVYSGEYEAEDTHWNFICSSVMQMTPAASDDRSQHWKSLFPQVFTLLCPDYRDKTL